MADQQKASKQLRVRPFIVLRLLHWLIDRNHPIFRDKGTAVVLKQKMDAAVAREYPETEEHRPVKERAGHIPESILRMLDEQAVGHGEQEPTSATAEAKVKQSLHAELGPHSAMIRLVGHSTAILSTLLDITQYKIWGQR